MLHSEVITDVFWVSYEIEKSILQQENWLSSFITPEGSSIQ